MDLDMQFSRYVFGPFQDLVNIAGFGPASASVRHVLYILI